MGGGNRVGWEVKRREGVEIRSRLVVIMAVEMQGVVVVVAGWMGQVVEREAEYDIWIE